MCASVWLPLLIIVLPCTKLTFDKSGGRWASVLLPCRLNDPLTLILYLIKRTDTHAIRNAHQIWAFYHLLLQFRSMVENICWPRDIHLLAFKLRKFSAMCNNIFTKFLVRLWCIVITWPENASAGYGWHENPSTEFALPSCRTDRGTGGQKCRQKRVRNAAS